MKGRRRHIIKFLPLAIGVLLLTVGALFVPWREVVPYLMTLTPLSYGLILGLGMAFYLARIMRYNYMLRVLKAPHSFRRTVVAYFEAQPVSLIPGGEAYRTITLKKHIDVPFSKSVFVFFVTASTENIGLVVLALISAMLLKQQIVIVLALAFVYIIILLLLRTRRTADRSRRVLNKLPFVNLAKAKFMAFIGKNKTLLSGASLVVLLLTSVVSTLIASLLLLLIANDMGIEFNFAQAVVAFTLPTVLQNVTFLPGGIGVNEQGSVGIMVLLGASLPAAVALTIIMRLVTLGLGVVLGLLTIAVAKVHPAIES